MPPAITTSLKRSRSSTPSLGSHPSTPTADKDTSNTDLATGEVQIKQELEHWENIQFSFRMDDERRDQKDPNYLGDDPSHPHSYIHQLPGARILPGRSHDAPIVPNPSPWDMPPFFPQSTYGQQPPYDVLSLGAIGPMPELDVPHPHPNPHPNPHAPFGLYGPSAWDLNFYPELQQPQPQTHLPALSPAEIAQYHALMARGAAAFPPPTSPASPSASTSSAPAAPVSQVDPSTRGRSMSSAGRSSSQSRAISAPTSPLDDESVAVVAEDKRRRNTAASARFRVKKKQRTAELERTLAELEGRAGELEKEAVELRKENGWLKEMVILKGRKAIEAAKASTSGTRPDNDGAESEGKESEDGGGDGGKGKSKE
ncbi:hypothetical protein FRC08_007642 [Ceratobasidium sp. 394]|nr:hypothetical protein FRC08_007642 [Ceratobasidium sp. 394]KAG9075823.1 hypothetical protein FS749_012468 [Ceratobasidium sp. UAMH 11750]